MTTLAGALRIVTLVVAAMLVAGVQPAQARLAKLNKAAAEASDPSCCPQPCIRYVHRGCATVCCGCKPPVETVLKVVNPHTCCAVDVPVCLPACCDGCPTVASRCGILCRGVVTYDWCCGYRVVVRFDRCGDVTVVYRG
ncbi:MAG: hypothetical protein HYX69_14160 [Planctomycetia bacterium]|nr:hypothetical protein [Planctomycetia bacterium]